MVSYINERKVHGLAFAFKKNMWRMEGELRVVDYTENIKGHYKSKEFKGKNDQYAIIALFKSL